MLIGGDNRTGSVAFKSNSTGTKSVFVRPGGWSQNASDLVCQHLGFKGAYATVSVQPPSESPGTPQYAANVTCPKSATNITECFYEEDLGRIETEDTIRVFCCTGYQSLLSFLLSFLLIFLSF